MIYHVRSKSVMYGAEEMLEIRWIGKITGYEWNKMLVVDSQARYL